MLRCRKVEFFDGHAVYRDSRRKAEVILDQISLPLAFDPTWNQWRHLISSKFGVEATFVKSGQYRFRNGEWCLVDWETALPSRLRITLPGDTQEVLANARKTYHRFGEFYDAIQKIRLRLEREPLERAELDRICGELGIPPDFDIAQISWKPDYDSFYYSQLRKRTRKLFLFRDEYIFELEHATVVEVPQQGHATYVFSRPPNLDQWVRAYARAAQGRHPPESGERGRATRLPRPRHARTKSKKPGCATSARKSVSRWTTHSRWRRRLNGLPCAAMVDSFPLPRSAPGATARKAWHLSHSGYQSSLTEERAAGIRYHKAHNRRLRVAHQQQTVARIVMLVCVLILMMLGISRLWTQ